MNEYKLLLLPGDGRSVGASRSDQFKKAENLS
jgi:hypothetical protein